MNALTALWLPILLSAVAVFFASWVVHMLLPLHRSDFRRMAGEDEVLEAMRRGGVKPGDYMFPWYPHAEMAKPEVREKFARGPSGSMTVMPTGPWNMGSSLGLWFAYLLVMGVFVAYVTSRTVAPGDDYLSVFRVAGTTAFLAYAGAHPAQSIWYKRAWSTTFKHIFDGLLYALLTAGVFGWLWP